VTILLLHRRTAKNH